MDGIKAVNIGEDFSLNIDEERTNEQDSKSNCFQEGHDLAGVASLPVGGQSGRGVVD